MAYSESQYWTLHTHTGGSSSITDPGTQAEHINSLSDDQQGDLVLGTAVLADGTEVVLSATLGLVAGPKYYYPSYDSPAITTIDTGGTVHTQSLSFSGGNPLTGYPNSPGNLQIAAGEDLQIVPLSGGGFVVAETAINVDTEVNPDHNLYFQVFNNTGVGSGSWTQVNSSDAGSNDDFTLAATPGGGFTIEYAENDAVNGYFAQYTAAGAVVGSKVNFENAASGSALGLGFAVDTAGDTIMALWSPSEDVYHSNTVVIYGATSSPTLNEASIYDQTWQTAENGLVPVVDNSSHPGVNPVNDDDVETSFVALPTGGFLAVIGDPTGPWVSASPPTGGYPGFNMYLQEIGVSGSTVTFDTPMLVETVSGNAADKTLDPVVLSNGNIVLDINGTYEVLDKSELPTANVGMASPTLATLTPLFPNSLSPSDARIASFAADHSGGVFAALQSGIATNYYGTLDASLYSADFDPAVALPNPATVVQFEANESGYNLLPDGFAISDTEANVFNGLAALEADQAHITTVTATGTPLVTYAANFVPDEAILNKVVGNFGVLGTASALNPILGQLNADLSHITSIAVASGTVTASVATFTADKAALDKIGSFAISDTEANVFNGLAALEADQAHITTVTATGTPLVTYAANFVPDEAILNKVVGNFGVLGTASALNPILGQLNADLSHITSIAVASGTVTASVATFTADKAALDKIGSFAISDTEANVFNGLAALEADQAHITTVTATGTPLVTYAANFVPDEAVLNKVVGNFGVLGTASALNPILGQLNADLSHITSIAVASGTVTASVATFTADKAALDKIGSFAISDTEANVFNGLAALEADQAHITTVTATGTPLVTYAANFVPDEAILNKVVGNFGVLGTASALNPILGQLNADLSHITSIAVASGTVTASVATFTADKAALDKIGSFAISDTEANVFNGLAALEADQAHITTVTATGTPLVTYAANFVPDEAILNKVVGNFGVLGTANVVNPILGQLNADLSHITSVAFADATPPTLNITQAQATSDAGLLAKIIGSYVLNVANTNGSTTTTGHGTAALTINAASTGPDTITGNSGADAFIFKPAFGQDTLTNLNASDTITLPASEFGTSFATLLRHQSGSDTIITNAHNTDTLTLTGITATTLTTGEFKFV